MRTVIMALVALGLQTTGCTVAYNTQYVGDGPLDVPESKAISESVGADVVVSYAGGDVVEGRMLSATPDSLHLVTALGISAVPRSGITELKAGGSIAGSILGFVLGVSGGTLLGASLGFELGGTGKKGWDEFEGSLGGGMVGMAIGAVAGGWAGIAIGRKASSGNIFVWPSQ